MAVDLGRIPWEFTAASDTARAIGGHKGTILLGKIVCHNGSGAPAAFLVRDRSGGRILISALAVPASGGQAFMDYPPGTCVDDIFIDTIPATSFVYVYPQLSL